LGENLGNLFAARSQTTVTIFESINQAETHDQLDHFAKLIWRNYANGGINDEDAQFLQSCIDQRRPRGHASPNGHLKRTGTASARIAARLGSRFISRQRPRSPDLRASRDRRRRLGGSSALPDHLRQFYTEGQRAVLCIIAGEIKRNGICDLPIDKIAALAGVCRTTVQTTLHEARRLYHIKITERPVRGQKNLSNLVRIASPEWCAWVKRAPTAHRPIGFKTLNLVSTTKNTDSRKLRGNQ